MKKNTISLVLCTVLILSLLAACAGAGGSKSAYRDDVPVSEIGAAIDTELESGPDMIELSETYIDGSMKMDVSDFEEYCVKIATKGVSIDEYGVFKGLDAKHAKTIEAAAKDYLKSRIDTWMSEYRPEEYPKLENAEVRVCGNYVMYAILSDSERAAAFDTFEASLKAE